MNSINGFILTTLAGLSTMLGTFIIFFKKKNDKIIAGALSFAAGVMICVSFMDLIPEGFSLLRETFLLIPSFLIAGIFILIGIIVSNSIDKYIPMTDTNGLYRVGIISMLAIILHNIPEGIATFITSDNNITLGITLTIAIALHNIPEGISISVPIYYATKSRKKALLYTLISGLSEPLGALLAYFFLKQYVNNVIMGMLLMIIAGIMLHIAKEELLPTSKQYNYLNITFKWFLLGLGFMFVAGLFF